MPSDNPDRQRRLAEALRANLRRRKGQARGRADEGGADDPAESSPAKLGPDPQD